MTINEKLISEMYNSVFGDPWHGLPVQKIIENISDEEAFVRHNSNSHSIAELILHMWAWTDEITKRIDGKTPSDPDSGDWPAADDYKNEGLSNIKKRLFVSTEKLIELLKNIPEEKLMNTVGNLRDAPLGTGISFEAAVHGLAQHNAYHAGQISLLKKLIKE